MKSFLDRSVLALAVTSACLLMPAIARSTGVEVPQVEFENNTEQAGLTLYTPTFSIVVADIDNDGADDLFVGHHGFVPALYLNRNGRFLAQPEVLPIKNRADRHGFTFVDFDNDGDKDFVVAGGGADGIGVGMANEVFQNLLVEKGNLEFVDVSDSSDIGDASGRTRVLLPIANKRGDKVDLYSTGLHKGRTGSKNIYAVNHSTPSNVVFKMDKQSSLARDIESDGKDLFFDFDRDGLADFLSIGGGRALLLRNNAGTFTRESTELDNIWGVISAAVADFNNDGFPDLYLGGANGTTNSDHVVSNAEEIHFSVGKQDDDESEQVTFKTASGRLKFNFTEHIPALGRPRVDATDIFIGAKRENPKHRTAQTGKLRAQGKPENTATAGIYIWHEPGDDLWRILWRHGKKSPSASKGIIYAEGIELVETRDLEKLPVRDSQDYILINKQGKDWRVLKLEELRHSLWTNHLTAADFNNDGFIDVAGVQTGEDGALNGDAFLVLNLGNDAFSRQIILQNEEDDIFRADLIVHGFFNNDGLPDLFYTNGFGLLPSHVGPYQFWLNTTQTSNAHLLLELEGTTSNRDAIGAQIELYDMEERLLGYRELGSNFNRGQNTHKVHFGLGDGKGPYSLRIRWPGTQQWQTLLVNGNGFYHIRQP
jgi:FG-GAP-like repeat/ASPIC and UnbV